MSEKEVIQAARMLKNGKDAEVEGVTGKKLKYRWDLLTGSK